MREFDSVLSFAEHLVKLEIGVALIEHRALKHVLTTLRDDMKDEIGHYQDEAGPYPAWAPLAESTEADKAAHGYPADAPLLRTGELRESFRFDQDGSEGIVGSTDPVMVFHEFGTVKMPPRPVVAPALERRRKEVEKILGRALVEAIVGGEVLRELGSDYFGELTPE